MNSDIVVSVLMPVYNVEEYVEEALRSIINQTYDNLQIIVVDDASTDKTFDVVSKIAAEDSRVMLLKNTSNMKIARSLNKGLECAVGKYIMRMDGDDISALDRTEKFVEYLEKNQELHMVACSVIGIDDNGIILNKNKYYSSDTYNKRIIKYSTPIKHIWMCRRYLYEYLNGYRDLSGCEDYDFILRVMASGYKYANITEYYGYFIRVRSCGNTSDIMGVYQRLLHENIYYLYKNLPSDEFMSLSSEYIESQVIVDSDMQNDYKKCLNKFSYSLSLIRLKKLNGIYLFLKVIFTCKKIREYVYGKIQKRYYEFIFFGIR